MLPPPPFIGSSEWAAHRAGVSRQQSCAPGPATRKFCENFPGELVRTVRHVNTRGRLDSESYQSLWKLSSVNGLLINPCN